jgi:hypothetical protein
MSREPIGDIVLFREGEPIFIDAKQEERFKVVMGGEDEGRTLKEGGRQKYVFGGGINGPEVTIEMDEDVWKMIMLMRRIRGRKEIGEISEVEMDLLRNAVAFGTSK